MKKYIAAIIAACCIVFIYAEITNFTVHYEKTTSERDFDIVYYLHDFMDEISVRRNNDIPTTKAFAIDNDRYEQRFTLFTDTGTGDATRKMEYIMWALQYAEKAAGFELTVEDFEAFNDEDVLEAFNADFGHTCFVIDPESTYARGYKYMLLEFFCKKGQGIVMRTMLSNDGTVFTTPDENFMYAYHSFQFKENSELFW